MRFFKYVILSLIFTTHLFSSSKEEIRNKIDIILSKLPATTKAAVFVYNPLTEDTIYALNPASSMITDSNSKLFTTATALSLMGGDYMLYTKFDSDDTLYTDGVIDGNLYITGVGNSVFTKDGLIDMVVTLW